MNVFAGTSRFVGFFDECGDHSLEKIDKDFPLFVLALAIVERETYRNKIVPSLNQFKLRYWNHEGINLHSREIRKASGAFSFLQNPTIRPHFMREVTEFIQKMPFSLFVTCIRKQTHFDRYGRNAVSPYDLALEFTMERVVHFLEGMNETCLPLIAEARGKKEDADLERVFYKIMANGTSFQPAEQFKNLSCPLEFRSKRDNIAGIQIADLSAYPCARYVLDQSTKNPAYDVVKKHLYNRAGVSGWKVFP